MRESTKDGNRISSPTFEVLHPDGISTTSWVLDLTAVESKKVNVYLRLKNCPSKYLKKPGLMCKFTVYLGTETNPKVFSLSETSCKYKECGSDWGWDGFITVERLRSEGLLTGDRLQVCLEMTIVAEPDSIIIETLSSSKEITEFKSFLSFESLLGSGELSDIKIQCGSESFPVHKAILAGQSSVFKTMLTSGMEEVKSGVVNVTDMTSYTFEIILRYMYTGRVDHELDSDSLLEIIYGAEKYELTELKNYCFRKLVTCICEENVGAIAVAVHLYGAEEFVKVTLRKFIEPRFFQLVKSVEFRALVQKHNEAFF